MTNRTQIMKRCSLIALAAAAAVPAMIACGGGSSTAAGAAAPSASVGAQPGYGQPPPGYPQQPAPNGYTQQPPAGYAQQPAPAGYAQQPAPGGQVPPGATAAGATPAPLGSVVTTDPNQLAAIFAQAAAAGQAMMQAPGAVAGDPTEIGLAAAAAKHASGEQAQGQVAKGTLQEGGHLAFMVTMQPGSCYTIVGYSAPGGVKNLDLNLLAPPFYNVMAGQDTTDNNTPVIGATPHPMCPVIPLPLQYKVDISARSGAGNVAVQVYSKAK